jgi:hypothetical protein
VNTPYERYTGNTLSGTDKLTVAERQSENETIRLDVQASPIGTDKLTSSDKRNLANFVPTAAAAHTLNALILRLR